MYPTYVLRLAVPLSAHAPAGYLSPGSMSNAHQVHTTPKAVTWQHVRSEVSKAPEEASDWTIFGGCAALLCLQNAKEGGLSGWSSSIAVHNEIVRRRPDLARLLAGPWHMDRKGEVPAGKQGFFELPVFNYHQARWHVGALPVPYPAPA
jgi:hypothetical protein